MVFISTDEELKSHFPRLALEISLVDLRSEATLLRLSHRHTQLELELEPEPRIRTSDL